MRYTTVIHEARMMLKLSMNDYCVADCIYHLSNNPKSPLPGWCYASKQSIANQIGITKSWAVKSIQTLIDMGIVTKSGDGKLLKTTAKWFEIVVDVDYSFGVQDKPKSVYGVHRNGIGSTPPSKNEKNQKDELPSSDGDLFKKPALNSETQLTPEYQIQSAGIDPILSFSDKRKASKKKGAKPADECYGDFVKMWCDAYPDLQFDAVSGVKINSMIRRTRQHLKSVEKVADREQVNAAFAYLLAYVKRENHWVHGQDINVFDQKYLSVVREIRAGKPGKRQQMPSSAVFSKYSNLM